MQVALSTMAVSPPLPQAFLSASDSSDEALVRAARAGDRRACFAIWSKYAALVQRLARRFLGPGPDYADLCQEAFLRIFKRLDELREPAALRGFVVSVTLGVARNEVRRRRIRAIVGLVPEEVLPAAPELPGQGEAREEARALYRLLGTLSAEDSLALRRAFRGEDGACRGRGGARHEPLHGQAPRGAAGGAGGRASRIESGVAGVRGHARAREGHVKDKRETSVAAEADCQRLGDLAGIAVPVEARSPGAGQWAEIERRLDGVGRGPSRRLRWAAFAACAALALCVVGWLVARRPLGYRLQGCTLAADGNFETTANRGGSIAFEDGSRVAVEKDARFRLGMLPFGRGAEINLDEGQVHLAVVHRAKARWAVLAGPFRVDVTGTRFGVLWSRHRGQFRLAMQEGEVRVGGGPIPPDTRVHAGQTVNADLVGGTFEIANERALATEEAGEATAPALPREPKSAGAHEARPPLPPASPRKRMEPVARAERRLAHATESSRSEPAAALAPPPEPPLNAVPPAASRGPESTLPPPPSALPSEPTEIAQTTPTSLRVVIGETGQLANGFTGATWIASGEGTSFSSPSSWEGRAHLLPESGLLCTSGTVAGLSCVNEGMPQMQCNWGRNWGVAIGWHTRADQKAWGDEAARGIAVEFRGRSASYRLNAHLKGDPLERIYCVENYKSGQVVRPSMFKSECWFDKGDTLDDFQQVDTFNLQFSSGMSYVAFRYCVSAIMLFP